MLEFKVDNVNLIDIDWNSPIRLNCEKFGIAAAKAFDDMVFEAITEVGIEVDRDELIKALAYDREQYEKGYGDGYRAAKDEIVHCGECKYGELDDGVSENVYHCRHHGFAWYDGGHFCGYGERKDK